MGVNCHADKPTNKRTDLSRQSKRDGSMHGG